jgi:hypothetical protein
MKKIILLVCAAMVIFPTFASGEFNSRTLELGTGSGKTGDTVYLPLSVSGTGGGVGGIAITVGLDSSIFEVVDIRESAALTPEVVNPVEQGYCDTSPCVNPYSEGGVGTGALFFQFNDQGDGKALIAAAAAQALADDIDLMEIGIRIKGSVASETVFDISLSQTNLPQNTAAGYDDPNNNPIPVLVGLPDNDPNSEGNYPVTDTFSTTLIDGSIRVEVGMKEDFNGDGVVDINDLALMAQLWGETEDSPTWDPRFNLNTDPNSEGRQVININDLANLAQQWGQVN